MNIAAFTFVSSVLSYYAFYRYIVQPNEYFEDFVWVHMQYQIYYLIFMLYIIYNANRVINEVNEYFIFAELKFALLISFSIRERERRTLCTIKSIVATILIYHFR